MAMKKTPLLFILFLLITVSLSGCQWQWWKKTAPADNNQALGGEAPGNNTQNAVLKKFATLEELKAFLQANVGADSIAAYDGLAISRPGAAPIATTREVKRSAGAQGEMAVNQAAADYANDYSKTNVQVAGVDEADIVKTDGRYICAVA